MTPSEQWQVALADLASVGLSEIDSVALMGRFDEKYLIPESQLLDFFDMLAASGNVEVLEVKGERLVQYRTVYFDGPNLELYRLHRQGRRRRYKVRNRQYGGDGPLMLEVKAKGISGKTLKVRQPHSASRHDVLDASDRRFIEGSVAQTYAGLVVPPLENELTTDFHRVTLVDRVAGMRITLDHNLTVSGRGKVVELSAGHVLAEFKSAQRRVATQRMGRHLGLRPVSVSKYCLGVAALRPDVSCNRWLPTLRRLTATRDLPIGLSQAGGFSAR